MYTNAFARNFRIRFHEVGPTNQLTVPTLFNYMQELAFAHTASQGVGIDDMHKLGLTWVVSRTAVQMEYYPEYGDSVTGYIWGGEIKRLFVPRYFVFASNNTGKVIAKCATYWLMLHLSTLFPAIPADFYHPNEPEDYSMPEFFTEMTKIDNSPGANPLSIRAGQFLIDLNNHVNNRFYLAYAQDWLAHQLGQMVCIQRIQINFNSALTFDETMVCTGEIKENTFRVTGHTSESKNVFSAQGEFA